LPADTIYTILRNHFRHSASTCGVGWGKDSTTQLLTLPMDASPRSLNLPKNSRTHNAKSTGYVQSFRQRAKNSLHVAINSQMHSASCRISEQSPNQKTNCYWTSKRLLRKQAIRSRS
jgi:hypothetical protein